MDWMQIVTIIGSNLVLILGMLGTFVAFYLNLDKKIDTGRKETNEILRAIQQEMKDFHGRLCAIEERNKKS